MQSVMASHPLDFSFGVVYSSLSLRISGFSVPLCSQPRETPWSVLQDGTINDCFTDISLIGREICLRRVCQQPHPAQHHTGYARTNQTVTSGSNSIWCCHACETGSCNDSHLVFADCPISHLLRFPQSPLPSGLHHRRRSMKKKRPCGLSPPWSTRLQAL